MHCRQPLLPTTTWTTRAGPRAKAKAKAELRLSLLLPRRVIGQLRTHRQLNAKPKMDPKTNPSNHHHVGAPVAEVSRPLTDQYSIVTICVLHSIQPLLSFYASLDLRALLALISPLSFGSFLRLSQSLFAILVANHLFCQELFHGVPSGDSPSQAMRYVLSSSFSSMIPRMSQNFHFSCFQVSGADRGLAGCPVSGWVGS